MVAVMVIVRVVMVGKIVMVVMVVMVASDDAFPPSMLLTSPDRRLEPRCFLPPVRVLPALHQHHQGVEPEEDDDGDDDALQDDPDVDMV